MYCLITRRKSNHKPIPTGVYRNAVWQPIYPGSEDYCFSGQEILRHARYQFRIALQKSVVQDNRRRKKVWQLAIIDFWEIVDDYLDTLRAPWYRQESVWGINEGRIINGLREQFPDAGQAQYKTYLAMIMAKFAQARADVIGAYQKSEEYPLQLHRINHTFQGSRSKGETPGPNRKKGSRPKKSRVDEVLNNLVSFKFVKNKALAQDIIVAGYRKMAHQRHPDKGGSAEAMHELTELKNQLLKLLKGGMDG
jgi:hypothetical protein